jgi:hypothetical protein
LDTGKRSENANGKPECNTNSQHDASRCSDPRGVSKKGGDEYSQEAA